MCFWARARRLFVCAFSPDQRCEFQGTQTGDQSSVPVHVLFESRPSLEAHRLMALWRGFRGFASRSIRPMTNYGLLWFSFWPLSVPGGWFCQGSQKGYKTIDTKFGFSNTKHVGLLRI